MAVWRNETSAYVRYSCHRLSAISHDSSLRLRMNVHEFQAKQLFAQFGIPVPRGKEIKTPQAAEQWAAKLQTPVYVVKAQIHAGGRGKAGGVKLTKTAG